MENVSQFNEVKGQIELYINKVKLFIIYTKLYYKLKLQNFKI